MSESLSRAFVSDIEVRSGGDGRTIHGIVVPFNEVATVSDGGPAYREMFARGAFARTIQHRGNKVPLLGHHNARTNPLGMASLLREDTAGLYGEFKVSRTRAGDEALELAKDGAWSFSVGFRPIQKRMEEGVTVRTEVGLRETSLVTFPAYEGALVGGVRLADFDTIDDLASRLIEAGYELRHTTPPEGDPDASDTAPALVAATDPALPLRSAHQIRLAFQRAIRERGVA